MGDLKPIYAKPLIDTAKRKALFAKKYNIADKIKLGEFKSRLKGNSRRMSLI